MLRNQYQVLEFIVYLCTSCHIQTHMPIIKFILFERLSEHYQHIVAPSISIQSLWGSLVSCAEHEEREQNRYSNISGAWYSRFTEVGLASCSIGLPMIIFSQQDVKLKVLGRNDTQIAHSSKGFGGSCKELLQTATLQLLITSKNRTNQRPHLSNPTLRESQISDCGQL